MITPHFIAPWGYKTELVDEECVAATADIRGSADVCLKEGFWHQTGETKLLSKLGSEGNKNRWRWNHQQIRE